MIMVDDIIVNPAEVPMTPARTPTSLSEIGISVMEFRPGEASIEGTSIRTAQGQRLVDRRGKAATVEIILGAREDRAEEVDLPTAAYRLQQIFGSMQERETWIMRVPYVGGDFAGPILYKITGVVSLDDFAGWGRGEQPDVKLVLERDPVGYSTEEDESEEFKATTTRQLVYSLPPGKGTAQGLKRIRVTNDGAADWRGLIWAEECRDAPDDLSDPTAQLAYLAKNLTPKGGAAISAAVPPEVRAAGTVASGEGAVTPGLPTGTVAGDLLIMVVESGGATTGAEANTVATAEGWSSPPAPYASQKKGNTRLTLLYKIAVGGDARTTNDTGDHQIAKIIGIKVGTFDAETPFNTAAVGTQAATTAVSIPGATTTRDNCLIVAAASGHLPDAAGTAQFSGVTNAALTGLTERIDNTATAGDGGALFAATGVKASSGVYGATTATAVTEAERAVISLAVNGAGDMLHSGLTAGWLTILSSQIVASGHMTHRGSRRMLMRVYDPGAVAGNVQLRLYWRPRGASRWIEDNPTVSTTVVGDYSLLDLGVCRPQQAVLGEERWESMLQARALNGSGAIRIRDVYPLPTEQYAVLSEPYLPPTAELQATQPAGSAANDSTKGTIAWGGLSNLTASDNAYVTAASGGAGAFSSQYLVASNFGFPLPEGALPLGIVAEVERSALSHDGDGGQGVEELAVHIVKGGVIQTGVNKRNFGWWPKGDSVQIYGGSADTWGQEWTKADINSSGFGLALRVEVRNWAGSETARVDRIRLTVYYAEPGAEEDKVCFATRSVELRSDGVVRQYPTEDVWGPLIPDGFLPYAPAGGLESRPSRGILIPSQGDLETLPDSGTPNQASAVIATRPGLHFAREAA